MSNYLLIKSPIKFHLSKSYISSNPHPCTKTRNEWLYSFKMRSYRLALELFIHKNLPQFLEGHYLGQIREQYTKSFGLYLNKALININKYAEKFDFVNDKYRNELIQWINKFSKENDGAILINDEENICIMVNEEDHIRLQVFTSGLDLQNILNLSIELDEKLDQLLNFSFSKQYGYLTACPTNVGTGLRASVMVHLPALKMTGNLGKILQIVNSFGMTIRGVYGEESMPRSDIYQISNNQTLGMSENEIVQNLENITKKVIEQERLARKYLAKNTDDLEDRVYRSYGILTNARKLSSDECENLLSDIKLGTDLGIITELNDSKVQKLILYTKPASMQKYLSKKMDGAERDKKRIDIIKQIINEK